jgi:NhaP-type Na+/H+ or K+/H+ antiporter
MVGCLFVCLFVNSWIILIILLLIVECARCCRWCGVWPSWKLSSVRNPKKNFRSEEEAMSDDEVKGIGSRYKAAAIHNTIVINNTQLYLI